MDFSNIWQHLDVIVFGDQREDWAAADDAGKADMLRDQGLHEVSPTEVAEAVAHAYQSMPPHQAALLAPVNQVANVDVDVPGPGPAPAPVPVEGPGAPVPPPVDPELDPIQQLVQNVDFYVTNVSTNLDQSVEDNSHLEVDDRDTHIDNSTDVGMINNLDVGGFLGDHHDGGGSGVTFDNDVQSAGDDAIQIGEESIVGFGAQLNTGDGAVQNQGPGEVNAVTGDVSDSTIVQGVDHVGGNVTGDVGAGAIVNDGGEGREGGGDLTGVNTGQVGGNMVTADDHSAAAGGDQAIGNAGPVSQGQGDAIQTFGNVNTGEGDQTNINFNQNNFGEDAGGDVNFNVGDGTQTVLDNETDIDASTDVSGSIVGSENVAVAEGHGDAIANDDGNVANDSFLQVADNTVAVDESEDHSVDIDAQLGLAGGDVEQVIEEPAPLPAEPAVEEIGE
ncbi:MAG: hypothetical protein AAGF02_13210 [Actinomycetota bacterium]